MRISYSCPAHLKFGLTVEQWSILVALTGEAIDWLDVHEHAYDVWLLVAYAATSCALVQVRAVAKSGTDYFCYREADIFSWISALFHNSVVYFRSRVTQYHTWARRKDADAAAKLRKLRDCVRRWEGSISPDHMSARRKAGFYSIPWTLRWAGIIR